MLRSEEGAGERLAGRFAGGKLTRKFTRRRDREKGTFYIVTTLTLFMSRLEREADKMDHIEVANRKSLPAFIEEYLPER
jgi:hypothetical protein